MAKNKKETKAQEGEVVTVEGQTVEIKKRNPTVLILTFVLLLVGLCGLCALCGSLPFLLG